MKNLLKKTISILTALAVLLCAVSAFADEYAETGEATIPTFEVGRGISGTIQPDSAAEIRVRAARNSQVKFTLTLTDDCGIKAAFDGSSISLECPNAGLPVYTFTRYFGQNESHMISLTSGCTVGYSIISEPIPEEPVPEVEPEAAPEAVPEAVPEAEAETSVGEAPAPADEQIGEPMQKPAEAPEDEPKGESVEEQQGIEENNVPELQEPTAENETPEGPAVTTEENEPAAETGETEQPVQPETALETAETEDQSVEEEQPVQQEEQDEEQKSEQLASEEQNPEQPAQQEEQAEEQVPDQPETENAEGAVDSVEIIIAKSLTPDESWSGTVRKTRPTILKLDVAEARMIHMFVEGRDVIYSVQKSDRLTEDASQILTDSQTNRSITTWSAEAGSYLISIHAGENSLMARVAVTFMTDEEFDAWEAEQAAAEEKLQEEETLEETGEEHEIIPEEDENEPKSENAAERYITVDVNWDVPNPIIGDTAHLKANLFGYDQLEYSMQWQYSPDNRANWYDMTGETDATMDVVVTMENNTYYWRILVYVEEEQES